MSEFEAHRCPNGHLSYPGHPLCSDCGERQVETVDLSDRTATVVTWTTSNATPPGVREPNHLGIVEFDLADTVSDADSAVTTESADDTVRALVQFTTGEVETGDEVEPVYTEELREPGAGIREPASQEWDGYRFEPVQ